MASATRALLIACRPQALTASHDRARPISTQKARPRMVDVSAKAATERDASRRRGRSLMRPRRSPCPTRAMPRRAMCSPPRASPASWRPSARQNSSRSAIPSRLTQVIVDFAPSTRSSAASVHRGDRKVRGQDRRGDGSADRGQRRRASPSTTCARRSTGRCGHRHSPHRQDRRRSGSFEAARCSLSPMARSRILSPFARSLRRASALPARTGPGAGRGRRGPPHPAAFDVSAMDGYAVRAADVATVPARPRSSAMPGRGRIGGGHRRGRGGAHLHRRASARGADTIVIQEDTEATGEAVLVKEAPSPATTYGGPG